MPLRFKTSRHHSRLANGYYVAVHFPIMIAFLLLGYGWRSRAQYKWARNLVVVQTGFALVIHLVFPLAPPRMFPQWGFVDTMSVYGPSAYDGAAASVANQFAAMPSLHVGWALTIAYVLARTAPAWLSIPIGIHAGVCANDVLLPSEFHLGMTGSAPKTSSARPRVAGTGASASSGGGGFQDMSAGGAVLGFHGGAFDVDVREYPVEPSGKGPDFVAE